MRTLLSDIRFGLRIPFRAPAFAAAVIGVLALGIAANTAIFSLMNTVLLRPLPYDEPDRIVRLFHVPPQSTFPGRKTFALSAANFYDWKRDAHAFERIAIYSFRGFTLTGLGQPQAINATAVGQDFFETVRTPPAMGRIFRPDEDVPGSHVVIVSDAFWKNHLGSNRSPVGQQLVLNDQPYEIVGVMPPQFSVRTWGATSTDLWVPFGQTDAEKMVRENHNEAAVARLKPGITADQAKAELSAIAARLEVDYPKENAGWGATVIPLQTLLIGDSQSTLVMLLGAVVVLLLIACANAGNVIFTRTLSRQKEIATRLALGAGTRRVFQQLVVESSVLGLMAGALGLAIAQGTLMLSRTALVNQLPRTDELTLDWRVVIFAVALSVLTGILAGALPAVRAGRSDLSSSLREGGRNSVTVAGLRTRRVLIAGEVALSLTLLMAAGVMIRSLTALRGVDAGFNSSNVLTMELNLPDSRYGTSDKRRVFFDDALDKLRAIPGVTSAAAISSLPTTGGSTQAIVIEGAAELLPKDQPTVQVRSMLPGYFRTMNIPVLRGRDATASDDNVMLVSRAAADFLWGGRDPIGQHATLPLQSRTLAHQIIGIVGDVKQNELTERALPTVYLFTKERQFGGFTLVAKTGVPPMSLERSVRTAIASLDATQPIENLRAMDTVLDDSLKARRFSTLLLGAFAAAALVLASIGIFTVLSYIVRGRRQEIGIRTALGASTGEVLRMVIAEGMTPALVGIAIGAALSFISARLIQQLVWGTSATDPVTLVLVSLVLAAVAFAASVVPAYRAARIDPLKTLRSE